MSDWLKTQIGICGEMYSYITTKAPCLLDAGHTGPHSQSCGSVSEYWKRRDQLQIQTKGRSIVPPRNKR